MDHFNKIRVWPYGFYGNCKRVRNVVRGFVKSSFFDNLMIFCVLVNTVILGMERYNIPDAQSRVLKSMNSIFTYIFLAELGLKLIALGPIKYLKDSMNYLDLFVVILSIVELTFESGSDTPKKTSLSAFRTFRIFRTFRVLRVARLLRTLHSMQVIMGVIQRSMASFIYIALLLLLFIFIYALLGMQIFGGKFNFPDGRPLTHFDTFNNAFVTVF